jgi:hypothetical protein
VLGTFRRKLKSTKTNLFVVETIFLDSLETNSSFGKNEVNE